MLKEILDYPLSFSTFLTFALIFYAILENYRRQQNERIKALENSLAEVKNRLELTTDDELNLVISLIKANQMDEAGELLKKISGRHQPS